MFGKADYVVTPVLIAVFMATSMFSQNRETVRVVALVCLAYIGLDILFRFAKWMMPGIRR